MPPPLEDDELLDELELLLEDEEDELLDEEELEEDEEELLDELEPLANVTTEFAGIA